MAIFQIPGMTPSTADLTASTPIGISQLGTPVFDDITFPSGNYQDLDGETITYDSFTIQSARITVNRSKNIVETEIAGREGAVKELVSIGDYSINIDAKISELADVFPADQMKAFKGLEDVPESIEVVSKLLNDTYNVFDVVIKEFTQRTIQGSLNEVDLIIELNSDESFDVKDFLLQNK